MGRTRGPDDLAERSVVLVSKSRIMTTSRAAYVPPSNAEGFGADRVSSSAALSDLQPVTVQVEENCTTAPGNGHVRLGPPRGPAPLVWMSVSIRPTRIDLAQSLSTPRCPEPEDRLRSLASYADHQERSVGVGFSARFSRPRMEFDWRSRSAVTVLLGDTALDRDPPTAAVPPGDWVVPVPACRLAGDERMRGEDRRWRPGLLGVEHAHGGSLGTVFDHVDRRLVPRRVRALPPCLSVLSVGLLPRSRLVELGGLGHREATDAAPRDPRAASASTPSRGAVDGCSRPESTRVPRPSGAPGRRTVYGPDYYGGSCLVVDNKRVEEGGASERDQCPAESSTCSGSASVTTAASSNLRAGSRRAGLELGVDDPDRVRLKAAGLPN